MNPMTDPSNLFTNETDFLLVLDSRNATKFYNGTYNSNVDFYLQDSIRFPRDSIKMTCSVLSFVCPNSMYVINETNNILNMVINSAMVFYTIPYGNYNANTLITYLSSVFPTGFKIVFNTITNKFTLSNSSNFSISVSSTIGPIMGFTNGQLYASTGNSFTLPYTCNFSGLQNLNIVFNNLSTQNIDSYTKTNSSIIQPIPIAYNTAQIFYQRHDKYAFVVKQDIIDHINICLQDDLQTYINLNNQHWNLTLVFSVTRDIERFKHIHSFNQIVRYANYE